MRKGRAGFAQNYLKIKVHIQEVHMYFLHCCLELFCTNTPLTAEGQSLQSLAGSREPGTSTEFPEVLCLKLKFLQAFIPLHYVLVILLTDKDVLKPPFIRK
jgi:hypothetical protein